MAAAHHRTPIFAVVYDLLSSTMLWIAWTILSQDVRHTPVLCGNG